MNSIEFSLFVCFIVGAVKLLWADDLCAFVADKRNVFMSVIVYLTISNVLLLLNLDFEFTLRVGFMVSIFLPYLSRSSRLGFTSENRRWSDKLVWTSGVYLFAASFAVFLEEYQIATLCFVTFVGSTLYHRNREIRFFNLDNIFATSLLVIFTYSLFSSYHMNEGYFLSGVLGLPVAAFLLAYCGMPADVAMDEFGKCCERTSRPLYDSVHTLWHLVSGVGPILSCWYFYSLRRGLTEHSHIDQVSVGVIRDPWSMPTIAVCIGLFINAAGNVAGVMPLD